MSIKLTARQSQILDLINQAIINAGRPPTRAEIAKELGFKSVNAAEDHLRALERKGYITISSGTSRGIQLTNTANEHYQSKNSISYLNLNQEGLTQAPKLIPIIGSVAAGSPILASAHVEKQIPLDANLFDYEPDYMLRVRGNSMSEIGILDGDLLAVKSTVQANNGQIVVARIGDDVTVKRLHKAGQKISLLPENREFKPINIKPGDDFHIEGIAVGLLRTGKFN